VLRPILIEAATDGMGRFYAFILVATKIELDLADLSLESWRPNKSWLAANHSGSRYGIA
jgi:hypothetical protein